MNFFSITIILIAIFVLIPYFAVPIILKRTQYINASPQRLLIDKHSLPQQVREYFDQTEPELHALGFKHIGYIHIPDLTDIQDWYHALYVHMEHDDSAALYYMSQTMPNDKIENFTFIEFNTTFTDGSEISITTSPVADMPGICPNKHLLQIPVEVPLAQLYQLHTQLKIFYGGGQQGCLADESEILNEIQHTMTQLMKCAAEAGYQYYDSENNCYRPTWKGAIALGWVNIFPWNKLHQARIKHRANKLLNAVQA